MKSIIKFIGIIISTALLIQSVPAAEKQVVIRCPHPETSLQTRWDWVKQEIRNRNFTKGNWIGYSIEKMMGKKSVMGCWNDHCKITLSEILTGKKVEDDSYHAFDSQTIREAAQEALDQIDDKNKPEEKVLKEVALLFHYSGSGRLQKILFGNLSIQVDLENRPLIWLGKADCHESIALLTGLYEKSFGNELKENVVSAVGIHPPTDSGFDFLKNILQSKEHDDIRKQAAFWMGQQDTDKALTLLATTAENDRSSEVREGSVFAISQMKLAQATDTLIDLAKASKNSDVREKAVFWLGQRKDDPKVLPVLVSIVHNDPSENIREKAVFSISQIESQAALQALVDLARNNSYPDLREKAVFWLGQSDNTNVLEDLIDIAKNDSSPRIREHAVFAISQMDQAEALDAIIDLAYHAGDLETRKKAIFWIGQKASDKAVATLGDVVEKDRDVEIQKEALFALSQLPDNEGIPKLIRISQSHSSKEVRKQAIFWLGQSGDPRAVDALVGLLKKE